MGAPRFILAGGGTGGHIFPGLALADELRAAEPQTEVLFVGARGGMEERLIALAGWPIETVVSLKPRGAAALLTLPISAVRAAVGSLRLMRRFRPDLLVALGGYAACAPAIAAAIARVPVVVLEQNAIPGRVSRLLSRFAQEVHATYPESTGMFRRPERVIVSGNPLRRALLTAAATALAEPERRAGPLRLLCMGGSQGARRLNTICLEALAFLEPEAEAVEAVVLAGPANLDTARQEAARLAVRAEVIPFEGDMAKRYAWADLAVARAGATGLAELAAFGLPAILVPFPYAADNHQVANAESFKRAGAALVMAEGGLDGRRLGEMLKRLVREPATLGRMRACMRGMARPDAGGRVAARLLAMAREA